MEYRLFANTGVNVSRIGFGAMGMSAFYSPDTSEEGDQKNISLLEQVFEQGVNFIDTSDMYGPEKNEILISKFLKNKAREKVFLATKFGVQWNEEGQFVGLSGKADYVKKACDASLKRLGVDYIDLYYLHRLDPNTPIEETVSAMAELVKQGKVKFLGLSECGVDIIRRAHKVHPISAIQTEYSLWTRDPEYNGVLEVCKELNIAFVPYSPLGRGFLTGAITNLDQLNSDDYRMNNPRFLEENFKKNVELVEKVKKLAEKKGCTAAQICLGWLLAQGEFIFPIPGTTKEKYLKENNGSVGVKLTKEEVEELKKVMKDVQGKRLDDQKLQLLEHSYK